MTSQDDYESWKQARRQVEVPAGFADRVLATVKEHDARVRSTVIRSLLARVVQSRTVRIGACSLAVAACVLRIACVLATFWPLSGSSM